MSWLAAWVFAAMASSGSEWPHWRGPESNGFSNDKIAQTWPADGPVKLWQALVSTGFSSISISQERAYTLGNSNGQDTVWCLDALKGKVLWTHSYPARLDPQYYEGGPTATPTVQEGKVFTLSKWGDVFCLDAASGEAVWKQQLWNFGIRSNRWGFAGSPVVWRDRVLLNAGTSGVALDKTTGRMLWFNGTNVAGYATPQLFPAADRPCYLIFAAKNLFAIDPGDGSELWRFPFETGYDVNNTDPLIRGSRILLSSYNRGCALLDVRDGKPTLVYENKKALRNHLAPGILVGDFLYAFHGEAATTTDFRCINYETGEVKWIVNDPKYGSLISADGKLLILSEKGELVMAKPNPDRFEPIARAQILEGRCWTPPSIANGLLYARNARGVVVCVDLRPQPGGGGGE